MDSYRKGAHRDVHLFCSLSICLGCLTELLQAGLVGFCLLQDSECQFLPFLCFFTLAQFLIGIPQHEVAASGVVVVLFTQGQTLVMPLLEPFYGLLILTILVEANGNVCRFMACQLLTSLTATPLL